MKCVRYEMNQKELEKLEKNSLYTMRVNSDLKDRIIQGCLNELNRVVKKEVRHKGLAILLVEIGK